jgi:hypothetical protein
VIALSLLALVHLPLNGYAPQNLFYPLEVTEVNRVRILGMGVRVVERGELHTDNSWPS